MNTDSEAQKLLSFITMSMRLIYTYKTCVYKL